MASSLAVIRFHCTDSQTFGAGLHSHGGSDCREFVFILIKRWKRILGLTDSLGNEKAPAN